MRRIVAGSVFGIGALTWVACATGGGGRTEDEGVRAGVGDGGGGTSVTPVGGTPVAGGGAKAPLAARVRYRAEVDFTDLERQGLAWLLAAQNPDGGFGEDAGTESIVGNTALAALVLLRAGNTPDAGPHAPALRRALGYVRAAVRNAAEEGMSVEPRQGTQLQRKLGPLVDTFLAAQVLGEVGERMPTGLAAETVRADLAACVRRVEKSQQRDGSWGREGWAPVLQDNFGLMSLDQATRAGVVVNEKAREDARNYAAGNYDAETKSFAPAAARAGAGVELYATAASLCMMRGGSPEVRASMRQAALGRLTDDAFLKGFGSFGGEEFFSFWAVSDALCPDGGKDWSCWNDGIRTRIGNLQNQDGSWAGHHCVTGRMPCTAGALLTLLYAGPAGEAK